MKGLRKSLGGFPRTNKRVKVRDPRRALTGAAYRVDAVRSTPQSVLRLRPARGG
jgi:hypothetical protein